MIVEVHDKMRKPLTFKVTRLLVRGSDGTPICLMLEHSPKHITVIRVGDPEFDKQLRQYGVYETVIVTPHDFKAGSPKIWRGDE